MRNNVQCLLAASTHDPVLRMGRHPFSFAAEHPIIMTEVTIPSTHTEALKKIPFSYPCFYYMNNCGTKEVSITIYRPAVTSRSEKLSELWPLEQKTESV